MAAPGPGWPAVYLPTPATYLWTPLCSNSTPPCQTFNWSRNLKEVGSTRDKFEWQRSLTGESRETELLDCTVGECWPMQSKMERGYKPKIYLLAWSLFIFYYPLKIFLHAWNRYQPCHLLIYGYSPHNVRHAWKFKDKNLKDTYNLISYFFHIFLTGGLGSSFFPRWT